jgi:hypothetical protein
MVRQAPVRQNEKARKAAARMRIRLDRKKVLINRLAPAAAGLVVIAFQLVLAYRGVVGFLRAYPNNEPTYRVAHAAILFTLVFVLLGWGYAAAYFVVEACYLVWLSGYSIEIRPDALAFVGGGRTVKEYSLDRVSVTERSLRISRRTPRLFAWQRLTL